MKKLFLMFLTVTLLIGFCIIPGTAAAETGTVTLNFVQPTAEFEGAYYFVASEKGSYCYTPDENGSYIYYSEDGLYYDYSTLIRDEDKALFDTTHLQTTGLDRNLYMYAANNGAYVRLLNNPVTSADKIFVAKYETQNHQVYEAYFCKRSDAETEDLVNFVEQGDPNDDGDKTNNNQLFYYNLPITEYRDTAVWKTSGAFVRLPNNHVTASALCVSGWYTAEDGTRYMADYCLFDDVEQADLDTLVSNGDTIEDGENTRYYRYRLNFASENAAGSYIRLPENPVTDLDDCVSAVYKAKNGNLYTAWFCPIHYAAVEDIQNFINNGDPNDDGDNTNDHQLFYYDVVANMGDTADTTLENETYYIGSRRYSPAYIGDRQAFASSNGTYIRMSEEDTEANGMGTVSAFTYDADSNKVFDTYCPVEYLTLANFRKYINSDTVYYSISYCNTITVTEPTTVSFRVMTSKAYDVTTATVFIGGAATGTDNMGKKDEPNSYDEHAIYIDPADYDVAVGENKILNIRVAEKDQYGNRVLLPSRFTVTLTSGDGYAVKTLSGQNNKEVFYGESYSFRVKITKGYSAAGMSVKVLAGSNDISELIGEEFDSVLALIQKDDKTRNENKLVETGVDADGYCTFRIDNVTDDCKIMVSGVQKKNEDGTTSTILATLKRILRAILHFFGIDTSFLEENGVNLLTEYKVTIDDASFNSHDASYVVTTSASNDPDSTFSVLGGESVTIVVTCDEPDKVEVTWEGRASEYKSEWKAHQNRLTGEVQYSTTYYINNIGQDLTIKCISA